MRSLLTICITAFVIAICACSESETPPIETTKRPTQQQTQVKQSPWQITNGAAQVAMAGEIDDLELADAVAKAKSTAEQARKRWQDSTEQERSQWAIKWAAPTTDGNTEHVWIKPILTWSKFRIEGKLANQPIAELACDKSLGQSVSFPIEELSDWMQIIQGKGEETDPTLQGGYTMKLLQQRYGKPQQDKN